MKIIDLGKILIGFSVGVLGGHYAALYFEEPHVLIVSLLTGGIFGIFAAFFAIKECVCS